jgi:hypothetical protein
MPSNDPKVREIEEALARPFSAEEVRFKPQTISGNRALAVAFVDARVIMDRLDEVVGVDGWTDDYQRLDSGEVVCRLSVRLNGEWLTKVDVGGQSGQPDAGDRVKSAFSEALKRAAVKWGVARYLYRLPMTWCDYDPQRRQFVRPPQLPAWALPGGGKAAAAKSAEPEKAPGSEAPAGVPQKPAPAPRKSPGKLARPEWAIDLTKALNESGIPVADLLDRYQIKRLGELPPEHHKDALQWARSRPPEAAVFDRWLSQKARRLLADGKASPDELLDYVLACGRRAGETCDVRQWGPESVKLGIQSVNEFVDLHYAAPAPQPAG